jgi:hypothetical protein
MWPKAVWFYYAHVIQHEGHSGGIAGLPTDLDGGYAQWEEEARTIYKQNA